MVSITTTMWSLHVQMIACSEWMLACFKKRNSALYFLLFYFFWCAVCVYVESRSSLDRFNTITTNSIVGMAEVL